MALTKQTEHKYKTKEEQEEARKKMEKEAAAKRKRRSQQEDLEEGELRDIEESGQTEC